MLKKPLTRRGFLAGCAGTGAALACSGPGIAFAEGGQIGVNARPEWDTVHSICQGCAASCGFAAYTTDGELGKVLGDATSPNSQGALCARGYGFTQSAFSQANIPNPLRRKENGDFETLSWDEAYADIAQRLEDLGAGSGPASFATIYDGTIPAAAAYAPRFMAALGSGNVYRNDVTQNLNKAAAFSQVIGYGSYDPDIDNASLVLLVDTSYADITTPALVAALQRARERGARIIAIDPRMGALASFADDWYGVNPGTELALLLALCNQLIRTDRYASDFVDANTSGFEAWVKSIDGYTALWAEPLTGVTNDRIDQLAALLSESAPRVALCYGNGDIGAASYQNSSETARMVCVLNTLLGTWGAKGGALLPYDFSQADFTKVVGSVKAQDDLAYAPASIDFTLGAPFQSGAAECLQLTRYGIVKALFLVEADVAYDYASIPDLANTLENADLLVCLSQQMTQTAQHADYILPVRPSLESTSMPLFGGVDAPVVSIASQVLEDTMSNALPVGEIFTGLAWACGLGDDFDFTPDEAAALQLQAVGVSLDGLQQQGSLAVPEGRVKRSTGWRTPTGTIQFASSACADAGLPASPTWIPPLQQSNVMDLISDDMNFGQKNEEGAMLEEGEGRAMTFHLITGQQSVLGSHGYNVEELIDIAEKYGLDRVWINGQVAELLDIQDGDRVTVYNSLASYDAPAFVTQRIAPTAVYLPSGFGHESIQQNIADGKGFNPTRFNVALIQGGYGTLCTQEACVQLWKEGA